MTDAEITFWLLFGVAMALLIIDNKNFKIQSPIK